MESATEPRRDCTVLLGCVLSQSCSVLRRQLSFSVATSTDFNLVIT